jgi:hypothetical protein
MTEPTIILNGTRLTDGQAMTLRCALQTKLSEMSDPDALGSDETGQSIAKGYRDCAAELLKMIMPRPQASRGTS